VPVELWAGLPAVLEDVVPAGDVVPGLEVTVPGAVPGVELVPEAGLEPPVVAVGLTGELPPVLGAVAVSVAAGTCEAAAGRGCGAGAGLAGTAGVTGAAAAGGVAT
jgi:hypothetical protein